MKHNPDFAPVQPNQKAPEWEIDEHGRKFRRIGNVKEYMPTIRIDGVEIENTPEAVRAFNERRNAATQAQTPTADTGKTCPLYLRSPMKQNCKTTCALFCGSFCALAARPAPVDTVGKPCPFMGACNPSCALYRGGCTLANIAPIDGRKANQ